MIRGIARIAVLGALAGALPAARAAIVNADPSNYRALLPTLQPGDTMVLAPGTYTQGLPISGMNGQPGLPITITGPSSGAPAVFEGRSCCNTVSITDASYVALRSLRLDGLGLAVDGVKAESTGAFAHHITLEDLTIVNHGVDQQIVGISTKCPAWGWVIRRNVIIGAGTGLYLGDSNGSAAFVDGLIEYNLVQDTIGYNMQIKHQVAREPVIPPGAATTVIRHNVFGKAQGGSTGANARPNLLVGHFPPTGAGSTDHYEIYGNFLYGNPTEALFQAEGNVAFYQNLLVNHAGPAVHVQPQNDVPKMIRIFNNTIVASQEGITISGGSTSFTQEAIGNGVFAVPPITGGIQRDNVTDTYGAAPSYLNAPMAPLGTLDLYPRPGMMTGAVISSAGIDTFGSWNVDFNGQLHDGTFRGAYAGEGTNPGWLPKMERKPGTAAEAFLVGQGLGPTSPNRVRVFYGTGAPAPVDFFAYAAGTWGVNVSSGHLASDPTAEIVTGPGPGAVFGPQVRGFLRDATPMAKVNYYSYGTLKYGANVAAAGADADAYREILTGPGPGAVFGPHVRGWNVDDGSAAAITKINFFAYGTLKYGVNVAAGDVEADGFEELLTGPGPGAIFGPQVRGFDYDGATVATIAKINFNALPSPQYGCNLDGGDADGDGFAEIAATPGPAAALPSRFLGYDYDGTAIAALAGFDVTPFATAYGGRIGLGDVDAQPPVRSELLAGAGRDPAAASTVLPHAYDGAALAALPASFTPFPVGYGVNPSSGPLGY